MLPINKNVVPGDISNKIKVKIIESILAIDIIGLVKVNIIEFLTISLVLIENLLIST